MMSAVFTPVPDLSDASIDDLDRAIVVLAARINAATHDFLVLVRRFDERGGWLRWGFESCADWLHWRCDLSPGAARESLRSRMKGWGEQRADGLVAMAKQYLSGNADGSAGSPDHYQVVVHVDQAALTGGRGRSGLPIESVRRIACDSDRVILLEDEHGEPLSVARRSRVVPAAIKRALWARDKAAGSPAAAGSVLSMRITSSIGQPAVRRVSKT